MNGSCLCGMAQKVRTFLVIYFFMLGIGFVGPTFVCMKKIDD